MYGTSDCDPLFDNKLQKLREAIKGKVQFQEVSPETGGSFYTALFGEDNNFTETVEDDDRDKKIFSSPERRRFKQTTKHLPPAEMVCAFVKSVFEIKNLLHNVTPYWFKRRITNTKNDFDDLVPLFILIDGNSFDLTYTFHMMGKESRDEVGLFNSSMGYNFTLNSVVMTSMQRKLLNDILCNKGRKRDVKTFTRNLFSTENFLHVSVEPRLNGNSVVKYSHCVHGPYLNKKMDRFEILSNLIMTLFISIQPENYFNNVYNHIKQILRKVELKRPRSGLFGRFLEEMKDYKTFYDRVIEKRKEIMPSPMY